MKQPYPLLAFLSLLFLGSCNREYLDLDNIKDGGINPVFALPIASAELTVDDVLKRDSNDILQIDDANGVFLALVYTDSLERIDASGYYGLPGFNESEEESMTAAQITGFEAAGSIDLDFDFPIPYDQSGGVELTSVVFKAGSLDLDISSTFRHVGQVTLSIPSLTDASGTPFSTTLNFDGTSSVPATDANSNDLQGYTLALAPGNMIDADLNLQMTNSGNSTFTTDQLQLNIALNNADYSLLEGDFKNFILDFPKDSVLMRVFGNFDGGTFTLTNPTVTFNVSNSFGVPFQCDFQELFTENVNTGETRDLLVNAETQTFNVDAAETPGTTNVSSLEFNNANTNGAMSDVIEPTPKFVIYDIEGTSNPGSPTGNQNFITDESRIDVVADVLLPLEGFGELTLSDTLSYDEFLSPEEADRIESLLLRINVDNGFPLDGEMEAYVGNFNETTGVLDTLFTLLGGDEPQMVLESGIVDPQTFKVSSSTAVTTDLELSREALNDEGETINQVKLLSEGNRIIITTRLTSTDYANRDVVKVYSDYMIGVRFGVKVGTALNADDL